MAAGEAEVARLAPAVAVATNLEPWPRDHPARGLARGHLLHAHGLQRLGCSADSTAPLRKYVATVESSPPGTVTDDGRPIEMEIIAGRTELSEAYTAAGQYGEALKTLRVLRLYAPKKPAQLAHFDMVVSLVEARALRCANRLDQAAAAYDRGLRRAAQLGELKVAGTVPSTELTTHLNQRIEVSRRPLYQTTTTNNVCPLQVVRVLTPLRYGLKPVFSQTLQRELYVWERCCGGQAAS